MPTVDGYGVLAPTQPIDQMSWNHRIWTLQQATMIQSSGFDMTDMKVMDIQRQNELSLMV